MCFVAFVVKDFVTSLTLRDLNRATLARQLLLAREKLTTEQAVSRLVALQAQLPRPPFLGLWTRLKGFERTALHRALIERRIVRVTSLRGTLHLMTAADYLGASRVPAAGARQGPRGHSSRTAQQLRSGRRHESDPRVLDEDPGDVR